MVISFAIVYGTFWLFEGQEQAAGRAAQRFPMAAGAARPAPTPSLQTQPFKDLFTLRADEANRLDSYGWIDKEGGITRIPIERVKQVNQDSVVIEFSASSLNRLPRIAGR